MICSQPIVWVVREIKQNQQHFIEEESSIDLYHDQVVTPFEQFPIKDIHDASYRPLSGRLGFFYLHTIRGVFSYKVKESPEKWIAEYKKVQIK
ncbi:hypothetical protein GCM10010954_13770 [Halobacillus andaensis]|uniref:Uncharacterized protein n=1 Tax=Halobacillus andaensis TaxID=1176239 RepID=A0A917B3K1_HALAA|nr:hypothetical protein [Halobacillus andaensis]MBP2004179.1 hypothetical protein [Halobacillus andaensis]GGF16402.1 hypothetical protein GCM10010954_13770 [Halobacillus andaensis]